MKANTNNKHSGRILIIDDDPDICLLLEKFLEKKGFEVEIAFKAGKGLQSLAKTGFDVVLCDFRLPDSDGMKVLDEVKRTRPQTQVIIITGYSDVKIAIRCMKRGAFDYVTKPIYPEEIHHTVAKAVEVARETSDRPAKPEREVAKPGGKVRNRHDRTKNFVDGVSQQSKQVLKLIKLVAPTDMSVIVTGETGTGKEYIAALIHQYSFRSEGPFVAIDCGALPKEIAGSELFGHKKGAFTGAFADKVGSFEVASGGTLFLDEVGNLGYENQIKLLRVLQERKIRRLGDTNDIEVDVRILAATNENLWRKCKAGEFREDLYHRLNEFSIHIAPLREKKAEIAQFAEYFLQQSNEDLGKEIAGFTPEAMDKLKNYFWHGNLRELHNVVKRATLLEQGDRISVSVLPSEIVNARISLDSAVPDIQMGGEITDLKTVTERAERAAILEVLKRTAYNKTKTADILKVDRKTLYNKMKSYGISLEKLDGGLA